MGSILSMNAAVVPLVLMGVCSIGVMALLGVGYAIWRLWKNRTPIADSDPTNEALLSSNID